MAGIDFPASPNVGDQWVSGNVTWIWDGSKWGVPTSQGASAFVPITGGTMTGDLILNRDPVVALGAATKQSVDARGGGDNRIINGDMRIDQRNNGASSTVNGYTVDRWQYSSTQVGKLSWQRATAGAGTAAIGFSNFLNFTTVTPFSAAATDTFILQQLIEADMVSDFAWGTPSAQPVTLSFWAQSSLTGNFSGAITNWTGSAVNRAFPFSFNIPVASAWTRITVTIPGDTAGTWVLQGNAVGAYVRFDLGSGSNWRSAAGAWAGVSLSGVTGAVSLASAVSSSFLYITGVKLEIGSVATPFNRQSLAKSVADCQRYFQTTYGVGTVPGAATNPPYSGLLPAAIGAGVYLTMGAMFPVQMRATPTITLYSATGATGNISVAGINSVAAVADVLSTGFGALQNTSGSTWAAASSIKAHFTASAEL